MPGIRCQLEAAGGHRSHACLTHEPGHTVSATLETVRFQIKQYPRASVRLLAALEELTDPSEQCLILLFADTWHL
jgi:hypothetical protein